MKKAEEYLEDVGYGLYSAYSVLNKSMEFTPVMSIENALKAIRQAQEEAIKETVKQCAEDAETIISDDLLIELHSFGKTIKMKAASNKDFIYKPSILLVEYKLIKEL